MSDKHIVLVRIEPAQVEGKGATRGDVIVIRDPRSRITKTEKKRLLVLKLNLTKVEARQIQDQVKPRSSFKPITEPPSDPEQAEAWDAAMEAERRKLPHFGLKVKLESLGLSMKKVNDLSCTVEPVSVSKEKLIVKVS